MGEGYHIRVAYDGKDMEIMTLGPKHERSKELLGSLIEAVAEGLEVEYQALGSTTWKRAAEQCGVESDLCYCFVRAKLEAIDAAAVRRFGQKVMAAGQPSIAAVGPIGKLESHDAFARRFGAELAAAE